MNKARFLIPLCALAMLPIGGCTTALLDSVSAGVFPDEQVNFTAQNYAAADYLIQQAGTFIDRYAVIEARPLGDTDHPEMLSTYGKMVPEQIGVRLSQLGYRVDLRKVATAADTNYLKPAQGAIGNDPDFIVSGTFTRRRIEVDVSMRIIDVRNGRVIAVFDYTLPRTREIDELARPKPQILRLSE